jgi:predicted phosphodiesterase
VQRRIGGAVARTYRQHGRRYADLGVLEEPVLVFGGPYSNLEATTAVLCEAETLGIPPARIICTGDVVAYCAEPQATADLVRAAGIAVVMGNCEESLGRGAEDCGCGFHAGSVCDRLSAQWYRFAAAALDPEAKRWMNGLPCRLHFTMDGRRLAVVHGAASAINRYVFASTPAEEKLAEIAAARCDGIIAGHSGLPFTQVLGERLWHNAGVIGLPANDATPRAWYSVLTPGAGGIEITHHAFAYDHARAAAKMRRLGLPDAYAKTLETGLWDNCEILPGPETGRQGKPIELAPLRWPSPALTRVAS